MIQQVTLIVILLQLAKLTEIQAAKQNLKLSDSYLPVAMQVIAHLTDQMAFEAKDEPAKPVKPTTTTFKPTSRPMYVPAMNPGFQTYPYGWYMRYGIGLERVSMTTPLHKPGLFAPASPPKASDRISPKSEHRFVLLPLEYNSEYTVIEPEEKRTEEPLLSIQEEEIKPLMEPNPESAPLLPPHFESEIKSRSEFDDENLQYLSENVRDIIKMANDPDDERLIDLSELKAGPQKGPGNKLSSSNLRLLLLYDLLSREAKRQKLSDYVGFSPSVMQSLVASSSGGARAQLSMALSKMVDRNDCGHEYANNRAKEMVTELAKDESKLSSELRYLQPLVYIN